MNKLVMTVKETARRNGRFDAYCNGICVRSSRQPFLDMARRLIELGTDPTTILVMRHDGSTTESMREEIGKAAKLTVDDAPRGNLPPRFDVWRPFAGLRGAPGFDGEEN